MGAVHPASKDAGSVRPFWGFEGFGTVTVPSDAIFVETTASHPLIGHPAVRRGRDVDVVRAPAIEVLNEGVPPGEM